MSAQAWVAILKVLKVLLPFLMQKYMHSLLQREMCENSFIAIILRSIEGATPL